MQVQFCRFDPRCECGPWPGIDGEGIHAWKGWSLERFKDEQPDDAFREKCEQHAGAAGGRASEKNSKLQISGCRDRFFLNFSSKPAFGHPSQLPTSTVQPADLSCTGAAD